MIYTVTFNPSLDYIVEVDDFTIGKTNRTSSELMLPGGKGINVSIVLNNLGTNSVALGFVAGFVGDEIERRIKNFGITTDFINIKDGISRINLKLKSIDGTEINGQGPKIDKESNDLLLGKLDCLNSGDILILAGSIPTSMSSTTYMDIMRRLKEKGVIFVVDATSDLLMNVLSYEPFLIKPNHHELGEIFGVDLKTKEDVIPYAKKLKEKGAKNVLVSMGGQGAVLIADDNFIYKGEVPKGKLVNSVGAGDSMVAGFVAGYINKRSYEEAFKMGIACGSASAFSKDLATKEEVEKLYKTIEVKKC